MLYQFQLRLCSVVERAASPGDVEDPLRHYKTNSEEHIGGRQEREHQESHAHETLAGCPCLEQSGNKNIPDADLVANTNGSKPVSAPHQETTVRFSRLLAAHSILYMRFPIRESVS